MHPYAATYFLLRNVYRARLYLYLYLIFCECFIFAISVQWKLRENFNPIVSTEYV